MKKIEDFIKVADIHEIRIKESISEIKSLFPISIEKLNKITKINFLYLEMLLNRFEKLQYFLETSLIPTFLDSQGEVTMHQTMLDKINKMGSLGLIISTDLWLEIREVSKLLANEYPDNPEITVNHINKVYEMTPQLLEFYNNIKNKINTSQK